MIEPKDFAPGLAWYVVEANERQVDTAYLRLALAEAEAWAPIDRVRPADRRGKRAKKPNTPPVYRAKTYRFGRFFFVRVEMTASVWQAIEAQAGVRRVLSACPIPDEMIAFHRENAPAKRAELPPEFKKNAIVRIKAGPFSGFQGVIEDLDSRGVLVVGVEIFGRTTPVCFEVAHVELVELARSPTRKTFLNPADKVRAGATA